MKSGTLTIDTMFYGLTPMDLDFLYLSLKSLFGSALKETVCNFYNLTFCLTNSENHVSMSTILLA